MIYRRLTQYEHGCSSFVAKSTGTWKIWPLVPQHGRLEHYVKTYPWVCLGTAAAVGFLIVPKRSTAIHPDLAALTALARTGHLVAEPAPAATRGWVDSLLATIASMAVRRAVDLLGQGSARVLGIAEVLPPPSVGFRRRVGSRMPAGMNMLWGHLGKTIIIRIARPKSSKDELGGSSIRLEQSRMGRRSPKSTLKNCGRSAVCRPPATFLPWCGTIHRNHTRMVGETTMNRRNGSTPRAERGRQGHGRIDADIVWLAELQFELFRIDCRKGRKGMMIPVTLLLLAAIVAARRGAHCSDLRCGSPHAGRRPLTGGGLFDRSDWGLDRWRRSWELWGSTNIHGVVSRFRAFPRRIGPQHCLDQARLEAAGAGESVHAQER